MCRSHYTLTCMTTIRKLTPQVRLQSFISREMNARTPTKRSFLSISRCADLCYYSPFKDTPPSSRSLTPNTSPAPRKRPGAPTPTVSILVYVVRIVVLTLIILICTEPPSGQLRLASANTTSFTSDLLLSVSSLFPSTLMSTGGDEVNMECYAEDSETQASLNETGRTIGEALSDFVLDVHSALRNGSDDVAGKTPVVWEGES